MSDDKLDPTVELAASTSAEAAAAAAPVAAAGPEGGAGAGTAAGAEGQGHTEGLAPPPIGGVGERSSTPDEFVDATDAPASPPLSAHAHATEEVAAASAIPTSPTSTAQAAPTTAAQAIAAPTSPSAPTTTLQAPGSPTTNGDRAVELGSPISEVREKRKPSALQLDEVSAPARGSIEISSAAVASHAISRSRASSRASLQKRPWTPSLEHPPDSPTSSLISSLRQQLELLSDQATLLNSKLVDSISKHADLEDTIFSLQSEREQQLRQIDELEKAKAQWEESMNTGLLVERSQIRDEMQRLAAGLVEEEKRRGTEEERRQQVESEVDQLTASLFDQANTMVASERMARAQAEARERVTIENLAAAEAAIKDMQAHLQSLETAAKSGGAERSSAPHMPRRYLSSHPPYAEFLSLLSHLRALRPRTQRARELYPAPQVANLLAQPFLSRAVAEDHEPTLRLDAAPELSWLSRRNVGSAIIAGELLIEPAAAASFGALDSINCALCGCGVFSRSAQPTSRFSLKPFFGSSSQPAHSPTSAQVYVFRTTAEDAKAYPLCKNGWCLERLRSACALWHFVRTGIVTPVWMGEDGSEDAPAAASEKEVTQTITVTADDLLGDQAPRIGRSVSTPNVRPLSTPPANEKKSSGWGIGGFKLAAGWSSRPQTPSVASTDAHRKEDEDAAAARSVAETTRTADTADTGADTMRTAETRGLGGAEGEGEGGDTDSTKGIFEGKQSTDNTPVKPAERRSPSFATSDSEYSFTTPPNEPKNADGVSTPADAEEVADALARVGLEGVDPTDAQPPAVADAAEPSAAETAETAAPVEVNDAEAKLETGSPAPPRPERKRAAPPPPLPKRSERRALPTSNASTPTAGHFPGTPTAPGPPSGPGSATPPSGPGTPGLAPGNAADPLASAETASAPEGAAAAESETSEAAATEKAPVTEADGATEKPTTETEAENGQAEKTADASSPTHAKSDIPPPPRHFAVTAPNPGATATAAAEAAATSPRSSLYERRDPSRSPRTSTDGRPALPPRVNVRHASNPAGSVSGGGTGAAGEGQAPREKTFLAGDDWEVRTWKQVVRLKEDMWRARVGVVDDQ